MGHLTFVSKRLSAVGSKRISQFFDSAGEPRSNVVPNKSNAGGFARGGGGMGGFGIDRYTNANQSCFALFGVPIVRTILSYQQHSVSAVQMTHAQYINLSTKIVITFL